MNFNGQNWTGAGMTDVEEVLALRKALQAQEGITDVSQLRDLGALQPESLENMLKLLTFDQKYLRIFNDFPRSGAQSTLEQYNVQNGYGQDDSGWVQQMELGSEADPSFKREFAIMKYQRQLWQMSSVAGMVATRGTTAEIASKQAALMRCMRNINRSLYSGNSALIPESIDGVEKAINNIGSADYIIDLRGQNPTEQNFRVAAELITSNFGDPNNATLYLSPGAQTTLDNIFAGGTYSRVNYGQGGAADGNVSIGYSINTIKTSFGTYQTKPDIFLAHEYESHAEPQRPNPSDPSQLIEGKTNERAPDTPSFVVANEATLTDSLFAGTGVRPSGVKYSYKVYAMNRFGRSAASAAKEVSGNVAAGGGVKITITPSGSSTYPATGYVVLSTKTAASGIYRLMTKVVANGATPVDVYDKNDDIPGTSKGFLLDLTSTGVRAVATLAQLAPPYSEEYARIAPYRWGSVNMYATPKYYEPRRFVMFKNFPIGKETVPTRILV